MILHRFPRKIWNKNTKKNGKCRENSLIPKKISDCVPYIGKEIQKILDRASNGIVKDRINFSIQINLSLRKI